MYAVTGATGSLGRLVVNRLLKSVPAGEIVAVARNPEKAADLAAGGVVVREGDYDRPETLGAALAGVRRLLFISGSEVGRRVSQHRAVVDAAKGAGVELLAYASVLHADTSPLDLAEEHRWTEAYLAESGVPHVLLRNGWYIENHTQAIPVALRHGALTGSAGDGRFASAARADFAAAAAAVLTAEEDVAGKTYELAGDEAYTLSEFAEELSRQAGREVVYRDVPEAEYAAILIGAGLPEPMARTVAQSDVAARGGALFDDGGRLSELIGRPTTSLRDAIAAALDG